MFFIFSVTRFSCENYSNEFSYSFWILHTWVEFVCFMKKWFSLIVSTYGFTYQTLQQSQGKPMSSLLNYTIYLIDSKVLSTSERDELLASLLVEDYFHLTKSRRPRSSGGSFRSWTASIAAEKRSVVFFSRLFDPAVRSSGDDHQEDEDE